MIILTFLSRTYLWKLDSRAQNTKISVKDYLLSYKQFEWSEK